MTGTDATVSEILKKTFRCEPYNGARIPRETCIGRKRRARELKARQEQEALKPYEHVELMGSEACLACGVDLENDPFVITREDDKPRKKGRPKKEAAKAEPFILSLSIDATKYPFFRKWVEQQAKESGRTPSEQFTEILTGDIAAVNEELKTGRYEA